MYAHMRTLRLADGPDEVHRRVIAREELSKYADQSEEVVVTRD
jgi:acyl-CoA dehydrogenase